MKTCTHCKVSKPTTEFSRNSAASDGFYVWCKECAAARARYSKTPQGRRDIAERRERKKLVRDSGQKECPSCRLALSPDQFSKNSHPSTKDGLSRICRSCRSVQRRADYLLRGDVARARDRAYYYKHKEVRRIKDRESYVRMKTLHPDVPSGNGLYKYGLTRETYRQLMASQGGRCAICSKELIVGRDTHVDHDHALDHRAVRGLLCSNCNLGLGAFRDDPELMRSAIRYIERWRAKKAKKAS